MENDISLSSAKPLLSSFMINEGHHWENNDLLSGLSEEKKVFRLLLIDSNDKLTAFITTCLPDYKISQAINSANIVQQAYDLAPDLIIVSATLPVINGYECCKKIKEEERTSHVPVILLIGKVISSACTEALASEADDYLIEPFSRGELWLRVKKILSGKHCLHKPFDQELNSTVIPKNKIIFSVDPTSDHPFLKKIHAILEERLTDANFNVEELANRTCMSRANLHRKLKAITCNTPVDIINNYRLQRAAQYLKEGYNSSQTAFRTGFNSPAYFTKCFRKFYGLTPLEFFRQKP